MRRLGPNTGHLTLAALFLGAAGVVSPLTPPGHAVAAEEPMEIVSATVRQHGFACEDPKRVERDEEASTPEEPVWVIECEKGSYRVKYMGGGNPQVEPLSQ